MNLLQSTGQPEQLPVYREREMKMRDYTEIISLIGIGVTIGYIIQVIC